MKDIRERVAVVEQVAASSHKRIDKHDEEIINLRDSRHEHANQIQRQIGITDTHTSILSGIEGAVDKLTQAVFGFRIMAMTAIFMGTGFITFCGFVGGKLLHWW